MYKTIDERDRALANSLLRRLDVLERLCEDAPHSHDAAAQLGVAALILAKLAISLEHALLCQSSASLEDDSPCRDDETDLDADARWTVNDYARAPQDF